MKKYDKLEEYICFIEFLSEIIYPEAELILYNVDNEQVMYVENSFDDEMVIGSKMRAFEKRLIIDEIYKKNDYIVNFRSLSKGKQKLKSAIFFIKDPDNGNKPIGILTINIVVDKLIELRSVLDKLISGNQSDDSNSIINNITNMTFEELMDATIKEALSAFNLPPDRLTYDEKMVLISNLDQKGVFKVKGSVTELAQLLQISETSIYRYINKV